MIKYVKEMYLAMLMVLMPVLIIIQQLTLREHEWIAIILAVMLILILQLNMYKMNKQHGNKDVVVKIDKEDMYKALYEEHVKNNLDKTTEQ